MDGLVIDIMDLPRQAGSYKEVHLELAAPEGLGTKVIGAQPGSPLVVDASLTATQDGVLVRASAQVRVHGECVRCLRALDEERTVRFDELYLLAEAAHAQGEDEEGLEQSFLVEGATLDLEPALRDALVGDLPFRPLCGPDCQGLCSECGERLDELPADHRHESLDPRWQALASLLPEPGSEPGPESGQER